MRAVATSFAMSLSELGYALKDMNTSHIRDYMKTNELLTDFQVTIFCFN